MGQQSYSGSNRPRVVLICGAVSLTTTRRLLWIVAGCSLGLWALLFYWLHLTGNYFHVFLVAAIGVALMNLIGHYWTRPTPEDRA